MLQVLNSNERNQAFFQFLIFFLVTTILVVGAIYFNFRVPETERNYLREEVSRFRNERDQQKNFVLLMDEAAKILDSAKKGGITAAQTSSLFGSKMTELHQAKNVTDTAVYAKLNSTIIDAFNQLQMANVQMKDVASKDQQIDKLTVELNSCKSRLDLYMTAYGNLNTRQ